jgi:hypothetical protein
VDKAAIICRLLPQSAMLKKTLGQIEKKRGIGCMKCCADDGSHATDCASSATQQKRDIDSSN